jgi:phosphoribosylformylglycinamidine cyclo-ligase
MVKKLTYAKAGVDILKHKKAIESLIGRVKYSRKDLGKPLKIKGHFAGLISFGKYALALCTDNVGTKALVAEALRKYDTIGIDCIAMNVNDCICVAAEPLAFVDYIALQKPNEEVVAQIGIGLNKGAKLANISIIGGETAIVPELVKSFDLSGTCLGYVDRNKIITGEAIKQGNIIIGLRSSGIHSNGLTLARKALKLNEISYKDKFPKSNKTWGEVLLTPTRIYVKEILNVIRKFKVHGLAHITGSGIRKIARINKNVNFCMESLFEPHEIFKQIQNLGNITNYEMYQTFNMGLGFCIVSSRKESDKILAELKGKGAKVIGRVDRGKGVSIPSLRLYLNSAT